MGEIESAWLPPCVVLVINDNPYGLMFTLRYSYRSCPLEMFGVHVLDSRRLHDDQCSTQGFIWRMVMCRVELTSSMAWNRRLSEQSCLPPQAIIHIKRRRWSASSIRCISEDIFWLKPAKETWRRSLARPSHNGVWGSIWRSLHQACASKRNQERWSTWSDQDRHHLAQVECSRQRYDLDRAIG